jgi:cytochrome P450
MHNAGTQSVVGAPPILSPPVANPPVVSRLWSLLDSPDMIRNPIGVFSKYTRSLGDTFVFRFGGVQSAIVTSNPAVMQRVLKINYENYRKSEIQMKRMGHFLGMGLLTSHGTRWQTQRRLIQQGFSHSRLDAMAEGMRVCLDEWLESFDRKAASGAIDIYPEMMRITFRMVSRSLFSASIRDEDVEYISRTILACQEFMVRQIVQPYLDPWFRVSGTLAKYEKMRDRGNDIILSYIRERRRATVPQDDLLQILLDAVYAESNHGMSDEEVLHETMQLLVAGHETSSNALCWTLYLLSRHPEHIEAIRSEYAHHVGDSTLRFSGLPKLEYATRVIDESLRLYPPFWMVDRVAVEEDRVGDLRIPRGATVIVFLYGAHHSPALWSDAESFVPARFDGETRKRHSTFTYLPFGGGPRGCIGGSYAMLQMLMILGAILRRYDVQLDSGHKVEARPMIILRPKDGIRMRFGARAAAAEAN